LYGPRDLQRILPRYSDIERGILAYFKRIFVQTGYHKQLICTSYPELESRIYISGLPLPQVEYHRPQKEYRAGYFSRQTPDKGIDHVPSGVMIQRLPKKQYYKELSKYRAILVPARKETFGYVAVEAVLCGTLPVVPYDFCYPEIFGDASIYFSRYEDIPQTIERICRMPSSQYHAEVDRLRSRIRERRFEVFL
jgi:hypothetical protein